MFSITLCVAFAVLSVGSETGSYGSPYHTRYRSARGHVGPEPTCGNGGGPGEQVVPRVVGVVQPEMVLGAGQNLTELDHVPDVSGGDRGIRCWNAMGRGVIQAVDSIQVQVQVSWNLDGQIGRHAGLEKKE